MHDKKKKVSKTSQHYYDPKVKPFVKRVGGKRQIIATLINHMPVSYNNYFEPFVGGGAMFFAIQKEKSFLSDSNAELINAYNVIKKQPQELIYFLKILKYEKAFYEDIRARDRVENRQYTYNPVQRAGRFIYLNRSCFNGLHRVNSKGQFNVPMGSYTNPDLVQEENIYAVSQLLNKLDIKIVEQSFEHILPFVKRGDFVYFDPPYDTLSSTANFTSYNKESFGPDMQIKLRDFIVKLDKKGCKIMLSNHNTPLIRELYQGFTFHIISAKRSINSRASARGPVEEVIITNYEF